MGEFGGFINLSNFGELKNCIGGRIFEDLDKLFKYNLCNYNILKIKNMLIINIFFIILYNLKRRNKILFFEFINKS